MTKNKDRNENVEEPAAVSSEPGVEPIISLNPEDSYFENYCVFTKQVYTAYLRGIEPAYKTAIFVVFIAISVMLIAIGVSLNGRLDIIGAGIFGCVIAGLGFGQPWLIARMKTDAVNKQHGEYQRNITTFYDDCMVMENVTVQASATAQYTEVKKVKETEDFILLFVGKYCYCAIKTGFRNGEDEIEPFKEFIKSRVPNAKVSLYKAPKAKTH